MKKIIALLILISAVCHSAIITGSFSQRTYLELDPNFPTFEEIHFVYDTASNTGALYGSPLLPHFGLNRIEFTINGDDTTSFEAITNFDQCVWYINQDKFSIRGYYDSSGFYAYNPFFGLDYVWDADVEDFKETSLPLGLEPEVILVSRKGYNGSGIELKAKNLYPGKKYIFQVSQNLTVWYDYEEIIAVGVDQSWHTDLVYSLIDDTLGNVWNRDDKWFFRIQEKQL
jgi:hypothetical protein